MTSKAGHTAGRAFSPERIEIGLAMYELANDARRNGDHAAYVRLHNELVAFNRETAALSKATTGGAV